MLGFYEGFPKNIQKIVRFSSSISNKGLQHALVQVCHKLNSETLNLEDIGTPSIPNCKVIFELGIAEANNFNYLDNKEKDKLQEALNKQPFQTMDFLCIIRYYKTNQNKKTPLKFDHYMLRFTFANSLIEVSAYQEKGPMHTQPEEIVNLIAHKINEMFSKKVLKPLDSP